MAEPGLSEVVTSVLRNRTKVVKDNIGNNNAVWAAMKKEGSFESVSGGRTLIEEMFYDDNGSFMWYTGGQVLNTSSNPVITAAEFEWKQCAIAVTATGYEQRISAGPEGVIKFVAKRVEAAEITMMNKLNAAALGNGTGSGGKEIGGLDLLVAKTPTSGEVGSIDRSTTAAAFYRNYSLAVNSTFGSDVSAANVEEVITHAKTYTTRNGDGPTLGLAGDTFWIHLNKAAQSRQVLYSESIAKLGYENIVVCGIPFVHGGGVIYGGETLVVATEAFLMNPKYLKLKYHKDCFMDPLEERLSINQDATVKYIAFMGNMTLSNAKVQARIYNS